MLSVCVCFVCPLFQLSKVLIDFHEICFGFDVNRSHSNVGTFQFLTARNNDTRMHETRWEHTADT